MKFIALLKQSGEGCDYTIGCGRTWIDFESQDRQQALEYLKSKIIGKSDQGYTSGWDGEFWGDSRLSEVTLIEVGEVVIIPIGEWYADALNQSHKLSLEIGKYERRKKYEELKPEFEND